MAEAVTPVHEHVVHEDSSSNSMMNLLIGALIIGALLFIILYFGGPLLRSVNQGAQQPQIINNPPAQQQAPQINVPDKINVDVNNPGQ